MKMTDTYRLGSLDADAATRAVSGGTCVGHVKCGWGGVVLHLLALSSDLFPGSKLSVCEIVAVEIAVHVCGCDGCGCVYR